MLEGADCWAAEANLQAKVAAAAIMEQAVVAENDKSAAMVRGSKEATEVTSATEEGGGISWKATTRTWAVVEEGGELW